MLWYSVIKVQKNTPPPDDHKKHFLTIIAFISLVTSRHPAHCLRRHVNRYLRKTHHPQINLQYVVSMMAPSHLNVLHLSTVTLPMAFSAHTAAKYSAVLSGVFWHIVCAESKKRKRQRLSKALCWLYNSADNNLCHRWGSVRKEPLITCGEWALIVWFFLLLVHCEWIKLDWRPAAAAAWSPSAWAGWGKKSLAGLHIQRSRRFASGSL